ncbi:putative integral membrane protein (TIGR00698 family) [Streptosporangium becharense]|uniref:Putative integral membrane protein (TIGR00698 family) n=1 Tax=Streptosporangium becharense TaxID=1816182 RepID=A0A7W9ILR3_9ACTN|nr:putative sulfate exporter family transporter [Streptosporangium becharense]MBB2911531.1 putative integral membrane protein (TIGR00698 family) [Streptosporangium becharense]MBB5822651.1 putative integral membrane protein (TIGR00698 family) [Streptosporangium becharense]
MRGSGAAYTVTAVTAYAVALAPGLGVAACAVAVATAVSRILPGVNPAVLAVLLGAVAANLGGLHRSLSPGLRFASRQVLRLAVVLLGLQIALPDLLALGWRALAVVALATGVTFAVTRRLGDRLGVNPRRSLLIATGVSVCGAAAVAAMHEVAGSDDDDVAAAVAVVVLYGSVSIVTLPLLAGMLDLSPHRLGLWAGAAVHEVAQVAAIGAAAGAGVLTSAVAVKLVRVALLAPMTGLVSAALRRAPEARRPGTEPNRPEHPTPEPGEPGRPRTEPDRPERSAEGRAGRRPPLVPLFVVGFAAMAAARSLGVVPAEVTRAVPDVTAALLAAALFALGTGVRLRELARGGRSLLLGGLATVIIGGISLIGVLVIG